MTVILYQKTHDPVIPISSDLPDQVIVKIKGENGNYWRWQLINEAGNVVAGSDWEQLTTDDFTTYVLDGSSISGLSEGAYLFRVDVSTQPSENGIKDSGSIVLFLVAPTNVYLASLGTDVAELYILDNYIGAGYRIGGLTGSVSCPVGGRFSSLLYFHKPDKRQGRLIIPISSSQAIDTGYGTYAVIRFTLGFQNIATMRDWLYRIAYLHSQNKGNLLDIYENNNITDTDKIKMLVPYTAKHILQYLDGKVLNVQVDTTNYQIVYDLYVRLGFANIDWGKVLACVGIGAGIVAIAIGTAVTGGALGIGLATAGGFITGMSVLYLITREPSTPPTEQEKQIISSKASEGRTNVENAVSEAISTLDYYYNQGQVTQTAYENIKAEILNIKDVAINSINELEDEAKTQIDNAYKDGYNDAKEDYTKWIAVSGLAGLGFGYLIGRR